MNTAKRLLLRPLIPADEMPTGLYAGVLLSALLELVWAVAALAAMFDTPEQASAGRLNFGQAHFPLNGVVAWSALVGMVAITWGCRSGRTWARYAAAMFWIIPVAIGPLPTSSQAWADFTETVGFACCVAAYLFRNEAVHAYFARAEEDRAAEHAAASRRARS